MDGQNLSLDVRRDGDSITVLAEGEIDKATAPLLRDCLTELRGDVVLDLTALEFLDSTGLGVLISANRSLAETGGTLRVRDPQPQVRRVLDITGLGEWLTVET
jgi:anti-sigma B factor antagonist